jgi:hypothetical protein
VHFGRFSKTFLVTLSLQQIVGSESWCKQKQLSAIKDSEQGDQIAVERLLTLGSFLKNTEVAH